VNNTNSGNEQHYEWETLSVANFNTLNFAAPGHVFYPKEDPYDDREYARKVAWLGEQIQRINADVVCFQEVWDESALRAAVSASGLKYRHVLAPGAEAEGGAEGTPRLGLATRLHLAEHHSLTEFPPGMSVQVPEIGEYKRFERPVLQATVTNRHGQSVVLLVAHLKSKRPKFLLDTAGHSLENRDDPAVVARATLRSLIMRGAEAAALRATVSDILAGTHTPLVLAGDLNDGPESVTSQIIAATSEVAFDRHARDTALWHAYDVQSGAALRRDVAYSHVHQGSPEILDQIWVSEEFVPGSRFAIGDVRRVDYFNDHLNEGRDRTRSDHGFVRAVLRLRVDSPHAQGRRD